VQVGEAELLEMGDPRADSVQVRRVPVHVADAAEHSAGLEPAAVVFALGVAFGQDSRAHARAVSTCSRDASSTMVDSTMEGLLQ
jgi:hypothetical protein